MTMGQGHIIERAADELLLEGRRWEQLVSRWTVPGSTFAHAIAHSRPDYFSAYHEPVEYQVDENRGAGGPSVRLTGLHDPSDQAGMTMMDAVCHVQADMYMCETCCKVAQAMSSCSKCHHARYCSIKCQQTAWSKHKHKQHCPSLTLPRRADEPPVPPEQRLFLLHSFLRLNMRPDAPQLCRFWLASLISAVHRATRVDIFLPLDALVAFLWRYTWAAVPAPLRSPLCAALRRAVEAAHPDPSRNAAPNKIDKYAAVAIELCHAAAWLLDGDEEFVAWREEQPAAAALVKMRMGKSDADDRLGARMRVADTLTHAGFLEPLAATANTLADGTAKLGICLAPRGGPLVASAFGILAARAAAAATTRRLIDLKAGALSLAEAQTHVVTLYLLDKHAAEGPPPKAAVPGRLVVPQEQAERFSYLDMRQVGVQALRYDWALQDLVNKGCSALPVEPLRFATVEDLRARRFMQRLRSRRGLAGLAEHDAAWSAWLKGLEPPFADGVALPAGAVPGALPTGPLLPEPPDLLLGEALEQEETALQEDIDAAGAAAFDDDAPPSPSGQEEAQVQADVQAASEPELLQEEAVPQADVEAAGAAALVEVAPPEPAKQEEGVQQAVVEAAGAAALNDDTPPRS